MSRIVFIQFGETRQLELKIDGDQTWMAVADEFVSFLQGCGYQVSGADVADYLSESYGSNADQYDEMFTYSTDTDPVVFTDGDVTLDDVMNMWGTTNVSTDTNTITITTK